MTRRWELDALRGLMLVLMVLTHLPTRLSSPMGQPFGYVSAAEGFVLLSAYMAGMVYARLARKKGIDAMRKAFFKRALKVYLAHAATLLFLFTVIAFVGIKVDQPAVKDLMSFYLSHPAPALAWGLLLIYAPPLLDILPMYIVFMLVSPWVLAHALRRGWIGVMVLSMAFWLLAQFGLGEWVYDTTVALTGLPVPFHETGSFATFSWQFLWIFGLWMGASRTALWSQPFVFPGWAIVLASAMALVGMVWRHTMGQAAFGANINLNLLFDKWLLGPLRLIDLFALVIVTIRFGPWVKDRMPRMRWLESMGAASLPVFCAHLVIVLLALAFFGAKPLIHPWWEDALMLFGCFTALYMVARITLRLDHPQRLKAAGAAVAKSGAGAPLREYASAHPPAATGSALTAGPVATTEDASRSPIATADSPPR
ncbi:MAG: OpgC domain-containing protein [Comamonadaceae bacterium]|nr:MAG: OpgC domain-containing protein [Comamonadaceae bacterium]